MALLCSIPYNNGIILLLKQLYILSYICLYVYLCPAVQRRNKYKEFAQIFYRKSTNRKGRSNVGCPRNKQKNFGSNRKKPKQDLVRLCFGLFWTYIETTETNRTVSKRTETTLHFLNNTKILSLSNCFCWSSVCYGIEAKQPKQTVLKQTKTNRNNSEKP